MRGGLSGSPEALGVGGGDAGEGFVVVGDGGAGTENDVTGPAFGVRGRDGDETKKIEEKNINSALEASLVS